MNSIIFNGATIFYDSPLDFHVIRGKLMIDTASYGQKKEVKTKTKVVRTKHYTGSLTQFLRESKLRVGKKLVVKSNNKKTIYGAVKKLGYTANIQNTSDTGEFLVTIRK